MDTKKELSLTVRTLGLKGIFPAFIDTGGRGRTDTP